VSSLGVQKIYNSFWEKDAVTGKEKEGFSYNFRDS